MQGSNLRICEGMEITMANAKEIQDRIRSIKDTMKITNAMYMISSSKLQRAKKRYHDTEPYFDALRASISRLLRHVPDVEHIYFDNSLADLEESKKKKGYIIVTADKGLAGAYNHNILKMADEQMKTPGEHFLFVVGEMGRHYYENKKVPTVAQFHFTAQNPSMHRARIICDEILEWYRNEELNEVHIIYTQMINNLASTMVIDQLLPLKKADFTQIPAGLMIEVYQEEVSMVPSVEALIENIVPSYITGYIYGALIESFCSEQNARMMTMDSANRNGGEMLRKLSIQYNRVRQAAITQEITEVISGAKVLKAKKKKLQ